MVNIILAGFGKQEISRVPLKGEKLILNNLKMLVVDVEHILNPTGVPRIEAYVAAVTIEDN